MIFISKQGENDVLSSAPKTTEEIEAVMKSDSCEKPSPHDSMSSQKLAQKLQTGSLNTLKHHTSELKKRLQKLRLELGDTTGLAEQAHM